ncbi:MAG: hypothetical protein IJB35_04195 [Oscillospiraceae bacterium]|nr:hypothetical protein [Oscillospiraceae bacterium]
MALRDSWKQAGTGLGHAAKDVGKAFAATAKTTIKKVNDWANGDEEAEKPAPVVVGEAEKVKIVEEDAAE